MSKFIVTTNHHWQKLQNGFAISDKIWHREFENNRIANRKEIKFFKYRNDWFYIDEFIPFPPRLPELGELNEWDGFCGDSFFTGTLVRFNEKDGSLIQVGYYNE